MFRPLIAAASRRGLGAVQRLGPPRPTFRGALTSSSSFGVGPIPPCGRPSSIAQLDPPFLRSCPSRQLHLSGHQCSSDDKSLRERFKDTSKKFKQLWKDYWYVLLPVHLVTSAGWFTVFYFAVKSGVDVSAILKSLGTSEVYMKKIEESSWTTLALVYACYKVATPARYTVTIAGTTYSIRYLTSKGYLKTTDEMRASLRDKTESARDKFDEEWDKAKEKYGKRKNKNESKD